MPRKPKDTQPDTIQEPKKDTQSSKTLDFEAVQRALSGIQKKYEVGLMLAEDAKPTYISSGLTVLDKFTMGLADGGAILLYGPMSSGKTTHAAKILAGAQRQGKRCLWVDQEGKFEIQKEWIRAMGVDLNNLLLIRGENWETNADAVVRLINDNLIDFIVVDSIAGVSPAQEKETSGKNPEVKELTASTVGLIARQMSKFSRFVSTDMARHKVTMLFISQVRADVSLASTTGYVKSIPQGGNAILHMANLIIRIRERKNDPETTVRDSNNMPTMWRTEYIIEKNHQTGRDGILLNVICRYGVGPDDIETTLQFAKDYDIVTRAGAYYSLDGYRAAGWSAFLEGIRSDKELIAKLVNAVASIDLAKPMTKTENS